MKSRVIVILLLSLLMSWILMTKKKLVVMDENVNLAMGQLGVQVSSQFDAAMLLVDLVESYTEKDGSRLKKMIQTEYRILTARSMPSDVLKQEHVIQKVMEERFTEKESAFTRFVESYAAGKQDDGLDALVLKLYEFSMSYPWPEQWLEECRAAYQMDSPEAVQESIWVQLSNVAGSTEYHPSAVPLLPPVAAIAA